MPFRKIKCHELASCFAGEAYLPRRLFDGRLQACWMSIKPIWMQAHDDCMGYAP